jgi:type IV pilus assembly protein PilM
MGRASGKSLVGLNIEPGYIAAVEGRPDRAVVHRAAVAPLAPEVVRDGEVLDVDGLAAALRTLFGENKLGRRVRIGVANQRIVMRTVDLPPMKDAKEIASAVRFQAQEHIPMPLDQAVLEHHSLGQVESPDGTRTRVVLVAARRDMIERLLEATRRGGLRPEGIDLSAFAMIRALHQPGTGRTTLYVSIGGMINLAIAVGTTCVFTRVVALGIESMAGELAERRHLTLEHAHGWLKHVGLEAPVGELEGDVGIVAESRQVLTAGVARITDDIRNSLDFYAMQAGGAAVERAVLTGPALAIPGFAAGLGESIGLTVEEGVVEEARPGVLEGIDAGRLTVATGLTLHEAPA